ncbi:hypothetical protein Lser_V15G44614 [Lactuca serriola]
MVSEKQKRFQNCPNLINVFSLSILKPPLLHFFTSALQPCISGAILLHLHIFIATLLDLWRHFRITEVASAPDDATKGKDVFNEKSPPVELMAASYIGIKSPTTVLNLKIQICGNGSLDRSNLLTQSRRVIQKVEHKLMVLGCKDLERRIVEAKMKITLAKIQGFLINNMVSLPHHLKSFKITLLETSNVELQKQFQELRKRIYPPRLHVQYHDYMFNKIFGSSDDLKRSRRGYRNEEDGRREIKTRKR